MIIITKRQPSSNGSESRVKSGTEGCCKSTSRLLFLLLPGFVRALSYISFFTSLLYLRASTVQILLGSVTIIAPITSIVRTRHNLSGFQWLGFLVGTLGIALIVVCVFIRDDNVSDSYNKAVYKIIGVVLAVVSELLSTFDLAFQSVAINKRNIRPLHVVGLEGLFSFIVCLIFYFPITYFTPGDDNDSYESLVDSIYRVSHDSKIRSLVLFALASTFISAISGVLLLSTHNTTVRLVVDVCLMVTVWGAQLFIHNILTDSYGEKWSITSFFQIGAMVLLFIAVVLYYIMAAVSSAGRSDDYSEMSNNRQRQMKSYGFEYIQPKE